MKILLSTSALVLLALVPGANAQQTAAPSPNLAAGKTFVSSDRNYPRWNRGLTDNSWVAECGTTFATGAAASFPKTVTVDLEAPQTLGYVALGVPRFGSTKTIGISLSLDGITFDEVSKVTFREAREEKEIVNFQPVNARYVRLTYLDQYQAKHLYSPNYAFTTELAVYAPGPAPVLPATATTPKEAVASSLAPQPADVAAPRTRADGSFNTYFIESHRSFLERGKAGPMGLLFVGDSITDQWRHDNAKDSWATFSRFNPANFGIGGDKTQHVLWRFENGELDGIKPKVVVLMIGTNNLRSNTVGEIAEADTKIVAEIHRRLPEAKVLLLGILPRGASATHPMRAKIKEINAELAKLDNGNETRFLDMGEKFLEADGSISPQIMADTVHPEPWVTAYGPRR